MAVTIGARELKNRLGRYLRMVREGTVVVVSDRGRPVAELRRIAAPGDDLDERLEQLVSLGVVTAPPWRGLPPVDRIVVAGEPMSETIVQEREDQP